MRELSLDHLRTLVAIADLGSLANAARALHLAAPTVTVQIAELESRLGGQLLVRGRGPAQATALGERFIARARRLLADVDDAVEDVRRQLAGQTGRVRVGASTGAIAHLLPPALARLARNHPGIDVNVQVLTSNESMARLAAGSLDLAVVALPQSPVRGVHVTPLRREAVVAFLPADWKAPKRLTPQWLAERPLIMNDSSTRLYRLTAEWFSAAGVHCRPRIELNYNDAIRTLVAAGYGAALLPAESHESARDPRIAVRPLSPALWRQLGLAVSDRGTSGPTRFVLDALLPEKGSAM
ncbi:MULTISPECIES: LysR family transcriptional regulator [unclassified Variovorax]|jgi:DNA-binding transcriptional LysR family regulator|uniref:LysR family transcriptional regulator n=1 Tax=unclassified Variovorax TaxID=663243 RepID=UPI0008AE7CB0|nr:MULTISPECIES: LysR family transcriptional regulator [unclassified Variovorax]SEK17101.1 DNA-binding transcriptional regulator, LysR family [Variovorax sp. OK202]SFE71601.1 DNA-binding transcriptional regulator, LysR family [Variovorax sp. OK212]